MTSENHNETATFAGGCFWCTEAVFKRLEGVDSVVSGYTGGERGNPSYEQVSTGATGHAEAIQIQFDPNIISYDKLLDVFFATHDPTTLNQQGADIGTQYRSAIFYHSAKQKSAAEKKISNLEKGGKYSDPIVTELTPFSNFYQAEDYHKDYYDKNNSAPYCKLVIDPKIQKLMKGFKEEIKAEYK